MMRFDNGTEMAQFKKTGKAFGYVYVCSLFAWRKRELSRFIATKFPVTWYLLELLDGSAVDAGNNHTTDPGITLTTMLALVFIQA